MDTRSAAPGPSRGAAAALLGLLAAGVRTVVWLRTAAMFDDGPIFLGLAGAIADGDWAAALRHPYHPLYPAAVAAVSALGLDPEPAAAAVSIAAGGAAVAAFTLWLGEAFDRRTAWAGGGLLALHPFAVWFSADVQSDGLYMALFLWSAFFLFRAPRTRRLRDAAAAGAFSGLAYLARPEGLGLALLGAGAAGLWGLAAVRRGKGPSLGLVAGGGAALLLAAGVPAALYVVGLRVETGVWQLTQKKSVASLAGLEDTPSPVVESPLAPPAALPRAGDRPPPRRPGERIAAAAWDLYRSTVPVLRFELLPFLAVGLYAARGRPGWRGLFVGGIALGYGVVLTALVWSAGYVSRRHALPPLLPLLGYAAFGLVRSAELVARRLVRWRPALARREPWLAGLLVAGFLVLAWGPRDWIPRRLDRLAERRAAEWVRASDQSAARSLPAGPVAAGRLRVAYYAGRPFVPLPSGPPDGMLHHLRARGVGLVIVDESKLDDHRGLREARDAELVLVHRVRAGGHVASVYAVPGGGGERGDPG